MNSGLFCSGIKTDGVPLNCKSRNLLVIPRSSKQAGEAAVYQSADVETELVAIGEEGEASRVSESAIAEQEGTSMVVPGVSATVEEEHAVVAGPAVSIADNSLAPVAAEEQVDTEIESAGVTGEGELLGIAEAVENVGEQEDMEVGHGEDEKFCVEDEQQNQQDVGLTEFVVNKQMQTGVAA
ncbi:hypothetical protein V6N13_008940 [Hibiscus sabdariffa]